MTNNTKLEDKLEGVENFRAWKYRVLLILEEQHLEDYVKGEVAELEGDEDKSQHKKNLVKAKRIIADSIKDHLIPHVSSLKTPKEMFDALTNLYEGKNINRKMTLRTPKDMFDSLTNLYEGKNINSKMTLTTQLKSVKMQS